jgi:hypothetical protein
VLSEHRRWNMTLIDLIQSAVKTVTNSKELFGTSPEEQSVQDRARAFFVLNYLGTAIEKRREVYRKLLLADMEKVGRASSADVEAKVKHPDLLAVFDGELTLKREVRESKLPEVEAFAKLVLESGLSVLDVCDEVKKLELNPSKIEHQIAIGKLKADAVNALKKVTYALVPKETKPITEALKG